MVQPSWKRLFEIACQLIRQVNLEEAIIERWTLGGGTAMMLQIDHRESRDVDIFLSDPQLLGFLNPKTHDFVFEIRPTGYVTDGSTSLKWVFENIGEIDFIVGHLMTSAPTKRTTIEGISVELETIPEIITKKIYYRGSSIKPRDIFDIAAAGSEHEDSVILELKPYRGQVIETLAVMERLNPEFVRGAIAELAIKPKFEALGKIAMERAKEILLRVHN
jgi:hypothetical protein